MRIVLVDPPRLTLERTAGIQVHPLGLGYLAAALAPRHEVWQLVADAKSNLEGADRGREVADAVLEAEPDLVGISAVSATFASARRVSELLRDAGGPDLQIVLGGVHPTLCPEEARETEKKRLEDKEFDVKKINRGPLKPFGPGAW